MADTNAAIEYLDVPDETGDDSISTEETADGGMVITLGKLEAPPEQKPDAGGFYENLADGVIPNKVLTDIANDLLRRIEQDIEAREPHTKKYAEGIKRTGMGDEAPGGATFKGASKVVHPMLTEACIDFEGRIIKEIWPTEGPVKKKIVGEVTEEKDERATRKVDYLNYQLTKLMKEARSTFEAMLTQVPLGGTQYIRQWQNARLQRPEWSFVSVDNVHLPANASSYYSAKRRTFSETISGIELKQRIAHGIYRNIPNLPAPPVASDRNEAEKAQNKVEGKNPEVALNLDEDREIYETMAFLEITDKLAPYLTYEEKDDIRPYLISIDKNSREVLAFYRDWEPKDHTYEPIDHLFEFPFLPWTGAYGTGLPHVAGGLSGAATGALRALLDSALIANMQGGYMLKGSGSGGQNKVPDPGEIAEIDSGMEADDIRKKFMPFSAKEPSTVLFQLLGFVVEAGKGIVRTSLDETPEPGQGNTPVPVGTQLSRVGEGLMVFSSIHGRTHDAFNRLLFGLCRLNRLYLPEFVQVDNDGKEIIAYRSDFDGPMDVMPVSDPTIYSDQQRMAQIAGLEQSAATFPQLYNVRAIQEWKLEIWKVPNKDRFLVPAPEPTELNAINENVAMALGKPVAVFPEQDHLAHIQAHLDFMQSPILGMNPQIAPVCLAAALKHVTQHIIMQYAKTTVDTVKAAAGVDAHELFSDDNRVKVELDRLLALTSQRVVPQMQQVFARAMPIIQQVSQMVSKMQDQQRQQQLQGPTDPAAMAAAQVAAQEVQRKTANDQRTGALTANKQSTDAALKQAQMQTQKEIADQNAATKMAVAQLDVASAQRIARDRLEVGQAPGFSDGSSLGGQSP